MNNFNFSLMWNSVSSQIDLGFSFNCSVQAIEKSSRNFCTEISKRPMETDPTTHSMPYSCTPSQVLKFLFISVTGKICKTQEPLRFFWHISLNDSQYFSFCQAKQIKWCVGVNTMRCVADEIQMILTEWETLKFEE